MSQGY